MEQNNQADNDIFCMVCSCHIHRDQDAIKCHHCERTLHSLCRPQVDEIWQNLPFTCEACMKKLRVHMTRKFKASDLPGNVLSNQIENDIKDFLQNNGAGDKKVTIRSFLEDCEPNQDIGTET